VEANGFLYNMVRNIVGTLVAVGKGKQTVDWPQRVLELHDRTQAGMTAPPQGLYLVDVGYEQCSDFKCHISDLKAATGEEPLE
jgi:tRNA pseudouridine38-40 synthase